MISKSSLFRLVVTLQFIVLSVSVRGQGEEMGPSTHTRIQQLTDQISDSLESIRRDFHTYPELAGQEERTSNRIARYLNSLGLEVHTNIGGYGVVGILRTNKEGKHIAWRADIDALASEHPDPVSFPSKNEGVRHICGHDVHTTIALGLANVLSGVKEELTGTLYFIFQPSEENLKGAKAMIDDGLFDLIDPDEMYALHIAPMPEGIITTKAGNLYADYKGIEIRFKRSGTTNALIAYTKGLLLELQNVEPDSKFWDNSSLLDPEIGLGNPNTIFKDYVTLSPIEVEEREEEIVVRTYLSAEKHTELDAISADIAYELERSDYAREFIAIEFYRETALVLNDEDLTRSAMAELREVYDTERVLPLYAAIPDGRSDDFSFFQEQVPGVYFLLGASDFEKGIISMPHSPNFAVDETTIRTGVRYFSSLFAEKLK